jgi:WD40 repeat protein
VSTFHVGDDGTRCCCFSPDGRLIAVAAGNIIYIWNVTSSDPHLVRTFIGHTNKVTSIVFSSPSTLISVSFDKSVKFWQVYTSSPELVATSPESTPVGLPLVSSISLQARDGIAISSNTAWVVKTWDILTSPCGPHPRFN